MSMSNTRSNESGLNWARAAAFTAVAWLALEFTAFQPSVVTVLIALGIGAIALAAPSVAVLGTIIVVSLPILAADFITGLAFLVLGIASTQFMSAGRGRVFLLVALGFFGAQLGPVWAAAALAGYLLGAGEGAIAGIMGCVLVQIAGLLTGQPAIGVVHAGGVEPAFITFAEGPTNLLSVGWLADSAAAIDPKPLFAAFADSSNKGLIFAHQVIWAVGAAVAGSIVRPPDHPRREPSALLAVAAAVGVMAAASAVATVLLGGQGMPSGDLLVAGLSSLALTAAIVAALEWVFPHKERKSVPAARPGTMSAEDADVDELLRLISTAEDQLATRHTARAVVMITDMKSFSRMTEEEGSVSSAKTIQRHRDLLMPIIGEHAGRGKSTGGDGLVAAFDSASDAIATAARMQTVLREYNASHATERDIIVRIGIADGEVVLDKSGRPFIGTALNLAARVMNLGDGGQILTTERVADAGRASDVRQHTHGLFELKNIAEPIGVVEILWAPDQQPTAPGVASG
jgi:class 3 adenylate cyclase